MRFSRSQDNAEVPRGDDPPDNAPGISKPPGNSQRPIEPRSWPAFLIGTSGWHYDSWRGPFFPKGLPIKHQLQYCAGQFPTAELNGVFYRMPASV
jgi:hypothetical protein